MPPLDPDVADLAPADHGLTAYDEQHAVTYLRMLDADADDADWRVVAQIVLHIDPNREPDRARQALPGDSYLYERVKIVRSCAGATIWSPSNRSKHQMQAGPTGSVEKRLRADLNRAVITTKFRGAAG